MSVFIGDKTKRVELAERKDAINPNLLSNSEGVFQPENNGMVAFDDWQSYPDSTAYLKQGQTYTISGKTNGTWSGTHNPAVESDKCVLWFVDGGSINTIVSSNNQVNNSNQFVWANPTGTYQLRVNGYKKDNSTKAWDIKVEKGSVATQWCPAYDDYAWKPDIASLQSTISSGLAGKKDVVNPNLFPGSKDFTGEWISLIKNFKDVQKDKYLDFTALYINWAWSGIGQYVAANKGETFTASAYVKTTAGYSLAWYIALFSDSENGHKKALVDPNTILIEGTGNWQKTSITFTVTSDSGVIKPRIEGDGSRPFWIAGMKLEKGTVATDWCPALADYAWESDITTLQSTLNSINSQVTALEAGYMKIETGYMKNPTVISQAAYDKLATKDPNTLYEITE